MSAVSVLTGATRVPLPLLQWNCQWNLTVDGIHRIAVELVVTTSLPVQRCAVYL